MISHLTNTVTFMTNSIGESRHVGHSITRFKSIYFYAVNSLIVQYMYSCIYLTDISNTNNSNQYTYTYMYFSNSIHNQSQSHLSSYHLSTTNISNNNHSNQYIYIYVYIYISQLAFITDHNHISIPISLSYYLFKDILNLILIHVIIYIYSFICSFTYTHSYTYSQMHSCILIHVYSFMYTYS